MGVGDIEREILGSMCFSPDCLTVGMAELKKEHFTNPLYIAVFGLIQSMYEGGKTVDFVTVFHEGKKLLDQHSMSWLMIKQSYACGTFQFLVDKLRRDHQIRIRHTMIKNANQMIMDGAEPEQIDQEIERVLYSHDNGNKLNIVTPKEHAARMKETLRKRKERKSNGGICTSYKKLNELLNGGFEPEQLVILAAQTGKGKTAFCMNLMRDIAIKQRIPALYINTEMAEEQMDIRWMTLLADVNHYRVASGTVDPYEDKRIDDALEAMDNGCFHSITERNLTLSGLISICRRYVAQKKCKFVVVDYIGRMDTLDPKLQEWQVLKTAAKRLKTIAQELGVTVIMLAQVNEDDKLEGARAMKNECDMYAYLRPLSDKEKEKKPGFNYVLLVEKNRSGPIGGMPLNFKGEYLSFNEQVDPIQGPWGRPERAV